MKRWIALVFLALFVNDVFVDAIDVACMNESSTEVCHSCVRGHPCDTSQPAIRSLPVATPRRSLLEPTLSPLSISRVLFHPPKALA